MIRTTLALSRAQTMPRAKKYGSTIASRPVANQAGLRLRSPLPANNPRRGRKAEPGLAWGGVQSFGKSLPSRARGKNRIAREHLVGAQTGQSNFAPAALVLAETG